MRPNRHLGPVRLITSILVFTCLCDWRVARAQEHEAAVELESPDFDERIVGGTAARPGEFPWAVAFLKRKDNGKYGIECGGTLIAPDLVLTAAHCKLTTNHVALVGRESLAETSTAIRLRADATPHSSYGIAAEYDSDIAVVRLAQSVPNIPVPLTDTNEQFVQPFGDLVVIGWGRTKELGPTSRELAKVTVKIYELAGCQAAYDGVYGVTDNMLCAGDVGKDACKGDSGGGAFVKNNDDQYLLAGVISFGEGCADPAYPGVYTRVSKFTQWIEQY